MPKYFNEITKEIVDYPADAAAIFPVLKPVPSERSVGKPADVKPNTDKTGDSNAK